jgi:serine/threonine-protein kinase
MAPEQARGEAIDARADVFAAGILLWELCAGRRMYRGSEPEMLALARAGEVPPLPERGLPEEPALRELLARALAPSPDARFASAADFQRELDAYASRTRLIASPLRFGSFLAEHFGAELIAARRSRERGALALELGPPAVLEPLPPPASPAMASTESTVGADAGAESSAPSSPAPSPETHATKAPATEPPATPAPTEAPTTPETHGASSVPPCRAAEAPARSRLPLAIGAVTLAVAALLAMWWLASPAGP